MKPHLNFYETLKEAHIRLRNTVVLYDGVPYYVWAITNHMKDGIFRIYLGPLNRGTPEEDNSPRPDVGAYPPEHPSLGPYMDGWIDKNPSAGLLRKQMNSPLFNKYRPFPLGMCNFGTKVKYLERAPARPKTEQGLTQNMIVETPVTLSSEGAAEVPFRSQVGVTSFNIHKCITADHPSAQECLNNLLSDEYRNEAVAFHREFAFVRGPIGMIFLAYRTDIIGILPRNNFDYLRLGKNFRHYREVCLDTNLFANVD